MVAPGSFPSRCLVAISHADAALTRTFCPVANHVPRGRRQSPVASQPPQERMCIYKDVHPDSATTGRQFGFGQRIEEAVVHRETTP